MALKGHLVPFKTFDWYQINMERRKPIVGGVKFSAHVAMKRMESVPDEQKKALRKFRSAFVVGAEGVEPPTLCL